MIDGPLVLKQIMREFWLWGEDFTNRFSEAFFFCLEFLVLIYTGPCAINPILKHLDLLHLSALSKDCSLPYFMLILAYTLIIIEFHDYISLRKWEMHQLYSIIAHNINTLLTLKTQSQALFIWLDCYCDHS